MADDATANAHTMIDVAVACALPDRQQVIALKVAPGCTAAEAVRLSGIRDTFPEIDWAQVKYGIFGRVFSGNDTAENHVLQEGDRVEIYRPLLVDPKESRRRRAAKLKQQREQHS